MIYMIYDNDNNLLLETDYVSTVVFFTEVENSTEHELTNEELVTVAKKLTQAYINAKVSINMIAFVDGIREFTFQEIEELTIYDIIDMAADNDY